MNPHIDISSTALVVIDLQKGVAGRPVRAPCRRHGGGKRRLSGEGLPEKRHARMSRKGGTLA